MRKPTTAIHDIRVAHGDEGRRLAAMQAQAILDVLTWTAKQQRPTEPAASTADEMPGEEPIGR